MHKFKRSRGFSLIEVLVSIGVVSILLGLTSSYYISTLKSQNYFIEKGNAEILRERIVRFMKDDVAWDKTIHDVTYNSTSNFNCLVAETDCRALNGVQTPFTPKSADDLLFMSTYDSQNPTHGFSPLGQPCTTYTAAVAGSVNCPIRYTFTWTPLCPPLPANCIKPQVVITGSFEYNKGPNTLKLNLNNLSFVTYKGFADENALRVACQDILQGVYDTTTKVCTLNYANFTCPGGTVVTGMTSGVPQCTAPVLPPPPPPPPPPPCCSSKGAPPICDTSC